MYMSAPEALDNIRRLAEMLRNYREGKRAFPFNDELSQLITPTRTPTDEDKDAQRWRIFAEFTVACLHKDNDGQALPPHLQAIYDRADKMAAPKGFPTVEDFTLYIDILFGVSVAPPVAETKEDPSPSAGDPS